MQEANLAVMDHGEANRRILAKDEHRVDFRRVEAASIKRQLRLSSGEAKRIFARCFYSFQASLYFISQIGRTKLPAEAVESIEKLVREKLEAVGKELDAGIDGAEALLKNSNIEEIATYDTLPLEMPIPITSALGRRYFEAIHKLDQLMPLLQTLAIEEIISEKQADRQRSRYKRILMSVKSSTMIWSFKVRNLMNSADAQRPNPEAATSAIDVVETSGPPAVHSDLSSADEETRTARIPTDAAEPADREASDGATVTALPAPESASA